ncbi:MAG: hypothetical protein ACLFWL_04550 [Candidatus Brocadiia bacterium]
MAQRNRNPKHTVVKSSQRRKSDKTVRRMRTSTSSDKGNVPWPLLFWICWPLALALGIWGGYMLRPPTNEDLYAQRDAFKKQADKYKEKYEKQKAEAEGLSKARESLTGQLTVLRTKAAKAEEKVEKLEDKLKIAQKNAAESKASGSGKTPKKDEQEKKDVKDETPAKETNSEDLFEGAPSPPDPEIPTPLRGERIRTVVSMSGNSNDLCDLFDTTGRWQFQYRQKPNPGKEDAFTTFEIKTPDGDLIKTFRTEDEYIRKATVMRDGRFYVKVRSNNAKWKFEVKVTE